MINIVLIDDHKLILSCMEHRLESVKEFNIVGTFTDPLEGIEFLKTNDCDILISDLMMESLSGIKLIKIINNEISRNIKVILISGFYDEEIHKYSLELGVKAFLRKEVSYEELVSSIINVYKGNRIIPEEIVGECLPVLLSEVELKVIKLVVNEYKNEQIAKELFLSKRTIENHINSICNKLNVNSRVGAVREVIRLGIV